jgi:hypothetical protein
VRVSQVAERLGKLNVEEIQRLRDNKAKTRSHIPFIDRFERKVRNIKAGRKDLTQ